MSKITINIKRMGVTTTTTTLPTKKGTVSGMTTKITMNTTTNRNTKTMSTSKIKIQDTMIKDTITSSSLTKTTMIHNLKDIMIHKSPRTRIKSTMKTALNKLINKSRKIN
jgi:hypothetical protein